MNETTVKNQAYKALEEMKKALILAEPYRNHQWLLNLVDELNKLSITY